MWVEAIVNSRHPHFSIQRSKWFKSNISERLTDHEDKHNLAPTWNLSAYRSVCTSSLASSSISRKPFLVSLEKGVFAIASATTQEMDLDKKEHGRKWYCFTQTRKYAEKCMANGAYHFKKKRLGRTRKKRSLKNINYRASSIYQQTGTPVEKGRSSELRHVT